MLAPTQPCSLQATTWVRYVIRLSSFVVLVAGALPHELCVAVSCVLDSLHSLQIRSMSSFTLDVMQFKFSCSPDNDSLSMGRVCTKGL